MGCGTNKCYSLPNDSEEFSEKASHAVNGSCEFFVYFLKALNASLQFSLIYFMQQGGSIQVVGAHVISYYALPYSRLPISSIGPISSLG